MNPWIISPPQVPVAGRCEYRMQGLPGGDATLFFEVEGMDLPEPDGTAALLVMLLPAMKRGATLRVEGAVDPMILRQLPGIQRIIAAWMPGLLPITVEARPGPIRAAGPATGVFFSGGVDSWYSLLKYAGIATHALHVLGFDIKLDQAALTARVGTTLAPAVLRKGVKWVRIRTNLRALTDPHTRWGEEQHGAAMGAVAALLSPAFGRIVMAGSYAFQIPTPFASHPVLDPLWSTSGSSLIHDGVEAARPDKLAVVMADPDALATMRVCFDNPDDSYNCGRCFKCNLTMLGMLMADPKASFKGFDTPLSPESLATCRITAEFWFRSLESRLNGIRTLLSERPDLAPYATVLERRLKRESPQSPIRRRIHRTLAKLKRLAG